MRTREAVGRGLGGDDVDGARRRVAAVERALRAFQHLDAFKVVDVEAHHRERAQEDFVDVDAGASDCWSRRNRRGRRRGS